MNPIIRDIKEVLLASGFEHTYILECSISQDMIKLRLLLPYHCDSEDLQMILLNLKEELNAHDAKISEHHGKNITLLFGKRDLSNITFNEAMLRMNTLQITLPSSYGMSILDFEDGASCHLLNGGTTRMGKTVFLLYMSTLLYCQTKGDIDMYIASTKIKDYYPFIGVPNVRLMNDEDHLLESLDYLLHEYKKRNKRLFTKELEKATDAKSVRKYYPQHYKHFKPIFLFIDEYARYAEDRDIQKAIMELVESAGYVNIHVIISTQRPDARTVLSPRIKANLLARICFTTSDKNNSLIILDQEGAEKLGKIQGRAIYLDSDTNIIQVPYISYEEIEKLMNLYKKGDFYNEYHDYQNEKRSNDTELTNKIQSLFTESNRTIDIQEQHESDQCMQPSIEETRTGWENLEDHSRKRPNVLLHHKQNIQIKFKSFTQNS